MDEIGLANILRRVLSYSQCQKVMQLSRTVTETHSTEPSRHLLTELHR